MMRKVQIRDFYATAKKLMPSLHHIKDKLVSYLTVHNSTTSYRRNSFEAPVLIDSIKISTHTYRLPPTLVVRREP